MSVFRTYGKGIVLPSLVWVLALGASQNSDEASPRDAAPASSELSTLPDGSAPDTWSPPSQLEHKETDFRGNWYNKRTIVNGARALYEEMHTYVTGTWEPQFQEFEAQYKNTVVEMKKSIEGLAFTKQDLEAAKKRVGGLLPSKDAAEKAKTQKATQMPEKPQFSEEQIATFQTQLEAMQEKYNKLEEFLSLFDSAVQQGQQQAVKGSEQEQAAWKLYEEIDAAYNDQQAAVAFEKMKTSRDYLQQLLGYLQHQLAPYCQQLATRFNQEILALAGQVRELEAQGIAIRPQKPVAVPAQPEASEQASVPWWRKWWNWIVSGFQWMGNSIARLWRK